MVTPIPISEYLPICTSPPKIAPGAMWTPSSTIQSCDTIDPELIIQLLPIDTQLPIIAPANTIVPSPIIADVSTIAVG